MKVGLSATMIQGGQSGVAQYVFALVRELSENPDIKLTVFVLEHEIPLFDFAKNKCDIYPVSQRFASPIINILWHQFCLPRLIKKLQIEILQTPSYRRLVWKVSCPTVATIHDLAPFHVQEKYDIARMFYGRVVVKYLARVQRKIIAVSQSTMNDIEHFFDIPAHNQQLIYNGIDHSRFHPKGSEQARDWMNQTYHISRPFFLFISRLEHPGKNHIRLIEAFTHFKKETGLEWQLVLGGGDWHGAEVIKDAAKKSAFAAEIHFLGFVPDADLPQIYRAAHCMIYPSLFEGFGLPPIEAMACGTPVISSTRGSLEEVVANAALKIDPESPSDIATAMIRLATDPTCANSLRKAGFVNAARFDWKHCAKELVQVYREILKTK